MAWDGQSYSAQASLGALLVGRHIGMMHLVCYLRDGDRVFETNGRPAATAGHNSGESAPATSHGATDAPSLSGRDSRLDALTTSPLGP
jgi:hypothetical protein